MRKGKLLTATWVMILAALCFTASCTKKTIQTEPVSMTKPETQMESDRFDEEEGRGYLQDDQIRSEAASQETTGPEFVTENIQFDFDSSVLSGKAQWILDKNREYLQANSDVTVTIEGHCDDRGTDTYNVALGQRRAESVKKFLVDRGISSNRLVTVSYGERHPIALGQNEASWAKNRRAQIVVNLFSDASKSAKN